MGRYKEIIVAGAVAGLLAAQACHSPRAVGVRLYVPAAPLAAPANQLSGSTGQSATRPGPRLPGTLRTLDPRLADTLGTLPTLGAPDSLWASNLLAANALPDSLRRTAPAGNPAAARFAADSAAGTSAVGLAGPGGQPGSLQRLTDSLTTSLSRPLPPAPRTVLGPIAGARGVAGTAGARGASGAAGTRGAYGQAGRRVAVVPVAVPVSPAAPQPTQPEPALQPASPTEGRVVLAREQRLAAPVAVAEPGGVLQPAPAPFQTVAGAVMAAPPLAGANLGATDSLVFTAYYQPNQLLADNAAALTAQLARLDPARIRRLYVAGYTDVAGSQHRNLELSRQRVDVLARYLMGQGVNPRLIYKQYFGNQYASPYLVARERQVKLLILLR